jgi:hypothetical protein
VAIQAKAYDPAYRVTKRDCEQVPRRVRAGSLLLSDVDCDDNLIARIGGRTIQDQSRAALDDPGQTNA